MTSRDPVRSLQAQSRPAAVPSRPDQHPLGVEVGKRRPIAQPDEKPGARLTSGAGAVDDDEPEPLEVWEVACDR